MAPATEAQRRQLLVQFDGALASGQWTIALRLAVVAELVRRTTRIQLARGGVCADEWRRDGGLNASDTPVPPPPPVLRPVFHGLAYGHRAIDLALMGAVGVRPIAGAVAGFEAADPLYVRVRVRNHVNKRAVQVPAVIGRAWIADEFIDHDEPETLARRCRALVDRPHDVDAASPLAMLELHAFACIPSGQLVLPPLKGPPKYEHLFGVANDTRHFWLTAFQTDRRQLPCAPILQPSLSLFEPAMIEPERLHAMRVLADARRAEERAMFQVMLGVWGIDRLILGRPLVWRDAAGAPRDDLRFFSTASVYPQWVPQKPGPRDDDDFLSARAPRRRVTFDERPMPVRRTAILKAWYYGAFFRHPHYYYYCRCASNGRRVPHSRCRRLPPLFIIIISSATRLASPAIVIAVVTPAYRS